MSTVPFKAATFNANSVRSRMPLILDWLERESPDLLSVQETKVQDKDFPVEPLREAGYHVVFCGQKAHAGVAIISREKAREVAAGFDEGEPDGPRLLRAEVRGIPVVNTYVPQGRSVDSPHFQYKLAWFGRLRTLFERYYTPDEPLLWVGDFNVAPEPIDLYDPKRQAKHVDFHPEARAALEQVRAWGFVDLLRRFHPDEPGLYTYWDYRLPQALDRGLGWRIDHIWATAPLADRCVRIWIDVDARRAERPSDHTFLVAEFEL
jgi:exodeoxyribonuclease-3